MKDALIVSLLSIFPRKQGARAMGWAARTGLSKLATRGFVAAYGVNMDECEGELGAFHSLEALFTRTLKPGVRPIDQTRGQVVSPVDGTVAFAGAAIGGKVQLVPGKTLDVASLVGQPVDANAAVAVLYLSPTDYHRVHSPLNCSVTHMRYVPGDLWPVFPAAVRKVTDLFSKNERCVLKLQGESNGWMVLVGAYGVGRISLSCSEVLSNTGAEACDHPVDPPFAMNRGDEAGVFHLGSTVVLVGPADGWAFDVSQGDAVKMGASIGRIVTTDQ